MLCILWQFCWIIQSGKYMNSTVQCLHSVHELKFAVIEYSQSGRSNDLDQSSHLLTVATRDLCSELDKNIKPIAPTQFWMDAEECWSQILYTLSQALRRPSSSKEEATTSKSKHKI